MLEITPDKMLNHFGRSETHPFKTAPMNMGDILFAANSQAKAYQILAKKAPVKRSMDLKKSCRRRVQQKLQAQANKQRQGLDKRSVVTRNKILVRQIEQVLIADQHRADSTLDIQCRANMTNLFEHRDNLEN
jgi:hypothetical protein